MTTLEAPVYALTPIEEVIPATDNLRRHLGDLDEMVASIRAVGIIEPIIIDDENMVVAGHRRLAAAFEAGLTHVPTITRSIADECEAAEIMLLENLTRADLNPIEEATGYARLIAGGRSQRDIAERVGCNQSHVSKRVKLLELDEADRERVIDGSLKINDALALLDPKPEPGPVEEPETSPVERTIRDAERAKRERAAIREGKASGLIDAREMTRDELVGLDRADREHATHWYVGAEGLIRWLGPVDDAIEDDTAVEESPQAGDRVEDGGRMGTLITCPTCNGDGLLHTPDEMPEAVEPEPDPAPPVIVGPATKLEDADAALWAAETDDHATATPWKAYPFVAEPKLIKGIAEHNGLDKLRHAVVYERAHKDRPAVISALLARIEELGA